MEDEVISFIDSRIADADREIALVTARRERLMDQRQKLSNADKAESPPSPNATVPAIMTATGTKPQWELLAATMSGLGPNRSFDDIRAAFADARGKDVTSTTLRSQLSRMKAAGLVEGGNNSWSVKQETPEPEAPGSDEGADGQGSGLAPSIPAGSSPVASTLFSSNQTGGDGDAPATT